MAPCLRLCRDAGFVYLLIRKLGRLALLLRFSAVSANSMAICIIQNLPGMFNENPTILTKKRKKVFFLGGDFTPVR